MPSSIHVYLFWTVSCSCTSIYMPVLMLGTFCCFQLCAWKYYSSQNQNNLWLKMAIFYLMQCIGSEFELKGKPLWIAEFTELEVNTKKEACLCLLFKIYDDVVYVLVGNTRLFLVRYSLWLIMTYGKVYVIVFSPPKPTMPVMVLKSSSWVDFLPWWKLELLCIIKF